MVLRNNWSEIAIDTIEKYLSDAESLIFHYDNEKDQCVQKHLFGSVEIISRKGQPSTVTEVLQSMEHGIERSTNFKQGKHFSSNILIPDADRRNIVYLI